MEIQKFEKKESIEEKKKKFKFNQVDYMELFINGLKPTLSHKMER